MKKEQIIKEFLGLLKRISKSVEKLRDGDIGSLRKHFSLVCNKCGSYRVFVSWEEGTDYGDYTGYEPGQKLFKCTECGNAYSIYS